MNRKNIRIKTAAERRIREGQAKIAEEIENKSQKQRYDQFARCDFERIVELPKTSGDEINNTENNCIKQQKKQSSTRGLPNNFKAPANAFPTDSPLSAANSSWIGVEKRSKVAMMPIIRYVGKSTRQPSPNEGMEAAAPHMAM